jgi:hypothetical protein
MVLFYAEFSKGETGEPKFTFLRYIQTGQAGNLPAAPTAQVDAKRQRGESYLNNK